jgi:hypothetical protein
MDIKSEILIYQTPGGCTKIDVRLENETVWLSQYQLADLFQTDRTSVAKHIKKIYESGELMEEQSSAAEYFFLFYSSTLVYLLQRF